MGTKSVWVWTCDICDDASEYHWDSEGDAKQDLREHQQWAHDREVVW